VIIFGLTLWKFLLVAFATAFACGCGWWLAFRILPAVFH